MVGRVIIDGFAGTSVSVDSNSRAELSLNTMPPGAEMPNKAVSEILKSQSLPKELPPHIHEKAKIIGLIQNDMKEIEAKAKLSRELETIRAKLLLGYKESSDGLTHSKNVSQALKSTHSLPDIGLKVIGSPQSSSDFSGSKKNVNISSQQEKDPNIVGQADQQRVIGHIEDALMAVDKLLGKINSDQLQVKSRILNLTGSIVGLNAARSTVDSSPLSLSVAMNTADMIMTNVKVAVVSHGNINTDIVRLVMS